MTGLFIWVGTGRTKKDYLKLVLYFSGIYFVRHFKTDSLRFCITILSCSSRSGSNTPFD